MSSHPILFHGYFFGTRQITKAIIVLIGQVVMCLLVIVTTFFFGARSGRVPVEANGLARSIMLSLNSPKPTNSRLNDLIF